MIKFLSKPTTLLLTLELQFILILFCYSYEYIEPPILHLIYTSFFSLIWVLIPGLLTLFVKYKTIKQICFYSFYTASIINLSIIFYTIPEILSMPIEAKKLHYGNEPSVIILGLVVFWGWIQMTLGAIIGSLILLGKKYFKYHKSPQ